MRGLVAGELASVVHVEWYGESTLNVTYRTGAGQVGDRLLFRSDEPTLAIAEPGSAFAFDGDPALYRLCDAPGDGGPGRHAPEGECFHRAPGHAELPGAQTAPAAGQR